MPSKKLPSITDIAAAVGVSAMSVSFALRGSPEVSDATREKILRQARQMGYRRDPLITQLMEHVRTRRTHRTQANLGVLAANRRDHFSGRIVAGVEARAGELGYAVDHIDITPFRGKPARLTQLLETRGIAGLILPPRPVPESLGGLLDWNRFTTVATSYSILDPRLNRVVPHHFHNAMLMLRSLRERGYRRPAFVVNAGMEHRTNHAYRAALACSHELQGTWIEPLIVTHDFTGLAAWIKRHRPDALVLSGIRQFAAPLRSKLSRAGLESLGLAVMDHGHDQYAGLAGIDQQPAQIGAVAVDTLVAQLHRHDRGVPRHPIVSMIEGSWAPDASIRELTDPLQGHLP